MPTKKHRLFTPSDGIHVVQWNEPATAAVREAIILAATDVGRVVRQLDTNRWYLAIATGSGADKWQPLGDAFAANFDATQLAIRNETGAPLVKGALVVPTGYSVAHGRPTVSLADKSDPALRPAMGAVLADIANGANGVAISSGVMSGFDTSLLSVNDTLVLGAAGAFSRPPPEVAPTSAVDEVQPVGQVLRVHATLGEILWHIGGDLTPASSFTRDASDLLFEPLTPGIGAQSTRSDQASFEGGIYKLRRRGRLNRIIFRTTGQTGNPTIAIGLYQAIGGGFGVAQRKATAVGVALAGAGEYQAVVSQGDVDLEAGEVYLLHGRDSAAGSYSVRTYAIQAYDLLNQNLPSGARPVSFATAIAASGGFPATFDPRESGTGQAIPSSLNVVPVLRGRTA